MRVGLVVPGFSADERDWCIPALRDLARRLATVDDVRVLALRYPPAASRYAAFGAEVVALGGGARRGAGSADLWRRAFATLAAEHRRSRFDVLHAFWATESGALTAVAGRVLRVPTVVSLAGGELVSLPDVGYGDQRVLGERLKVRLALRLADAVTAGSRPMLDLAAPWLRSRPAARRIPLGVDLARFHPDAGQPPGRAARLVHAASLVPVKDQATLLRAVAALDARGLPVALEIAGEGPREASLRALAARLGIDAAVRFHGNLAHERLPAFYASGDAFVLSSRHEAQGMAPLEAAAVGRPVVGTRVGVLAELPAAAGLAVPPGDHRALAAAIAVVVGGPRRGTLGQAVRALVEADYALDVSVARFRELYVTLLASTKGKPG